MQNNRSFRPATIDDADVLAELVNYAGEGMPLYLWGKLAEPGQCAWDVGRHRAAREDGSFSYRNATIIEHDGQCAGCLIGYEISNNPGPIPDDMPTMFVPLQELENLAPGSWYINVLAVRPRFRRLGLGTKHSVRDAVMSAKWHLADFSPPNGMSAFRVKRTLFHAA
jgi:ribosomal protein S18 acetylase RimI-like enzyme